MVISPFSVYESLVYLSHGANDSEKKIYSELLGSGMESIERYNMKVLEAFPVLDNGTKFVSNNSLWHDPEVRIKESFVNALNKLGGIEVFNQSPEGEKSKEAINNWVEEKTGGLIPEFLSSPLWGTTGWIFLNSIYFSSHWNMLFDPEKETTALFYDSSGGSKAIQYLRNNEAFYYYSDENIVVVELPSWNENYRMTLYMPSIPLDCWIENVSKEDMDRYHSNCKKIFLDLRMPKFNISSTFDLYPLIKELSGGKSLKLSGMLESGVANINQILQKVVLGIDEEGIRAAATTLSMTLLMDSPIRYKDVIFDRPFVYTIEETSTGTILFMGCMIQSDMAVR